MNLKKIDVQKLLGSRLAKDAVILGGAQATAYLLPLLAMPIIIRRVGMDVYGLFVLVQVVGLLTQAVVDYGFSFSATRMVVDKKNELIDRNSLLVNVTSAKIALYAFCFGSVGLILLLMPLDARRTTVALAYFPYSLLTVGSILIPLWYFQGIGTIVRAAFYMSFSRILSLVAIAALIDSRSSLEEISIVYSLPAMLTALVFWGTMKERPMWRLVAWEKICTLLADGRHVFATNVLSIGVTNSGPIIVSMAYEPVQVGLYAAAERIAKTISYVYGPLTQAVYPRVVSAFKESKEVGVTFIKKIGAIYIGIGFLMCLIVFLAAESIMNAIGVDVAASHALRWLCIWVLVSILNNVIGLQMLNALGFSRYYMRSFVVAVVIYFMLALFLTYYVSPFAPAIALLIGELTLTSFLAWKVVAIVAEGYESKI